MTFVPTCACLYNDFVTPSGIPIICSDNLYSRVSVDGLLTKNIQSELLTMQSPYFKSQKERKMWNKQLEAARAKPAKKVCC